nr:CHAT domain-containing protein [Roseofilum acuticapitatum]
MVSFKATKVYLSTLCTVVVSGLWVGFPLGNSSVAQVRSFQDWCEDRSISDAQKHTVSVLLQMAETSDCGEAQQVLGEFISLDLINREIEDIAPLSSLTHLKGLNLSFNQIRDITPLGNFSQLSFLLLSGNQIEDIGLSRSLIAAGTPSVLVSLWAVPDAPTSELMQAFYRELPQTDNRASALRQAMLATMETFPNPKAWAAFTLVGEGKTIH